MKILLLSLVLMCSFAEANDKFFNQLQWVKWSIDQEEQSPTEVVSNFLNPFNAYAYQEGDSCLVLGYQAKFTKGKCRLDRSLINKSSCAPSYYPCQPILFGEGICVKNNSKRLTHQCAVESLKKISEKIVESENMIKFKKSLLSSSFDISKLEAKDFPPEIQKTWPEEMTPEKLSQRQQYIGQLCQSIKQSKATGHQVQDLKDCESIHALATHIVKRENEEEKPSLALKLELEEKAKIISNNESKAFSKSVTTKKEDCEACNKEIKNETPAITDLSKIVEKIKKKESLLPEEVSSPIDFNKELPDDYCDIRETSTSKRRNQFTDDYKNEDFKKPENHYLDVSVVNDEAQGFDFEAHTMGKIYDGVESGQVIQTFEPTVPHRDWSAEFAGRGNQMFISISDWPVLEDKNPKSKEVVERYNSSNYTMSRYTFFPRKVTPSMSKVDGEMLMTLPTGEQVVFDANSRRVKEGAFVEKKRSDNGVNASFISKNGKLRTYMKPDSDISYQGKGVWIEQQITSSKDDTEGQSITIRTGSPTCKGPGCDSCKVPLSDVYERKRGKHSPEKGGSEWFCDRVKFQSDDAFDAYLKSKCKFSLPNL